MKNEIKSNTDWLTAIRGFACLIVVIAHIIANIPSVGLNLSGSGKIGVWLFFVLSAFLLTLQWLKKDKITVNNIIEFYIKRVFRIFPSYIVTLIFAFLVGYFSDIIHVIRHIFLIDGFGHFWTIPVEFVFYLIVPLLAIMIKKINNNKVNIILLLSLLFITSILFPYTKCIENSNNLKWYFPVFIMGMIVAFIYNKFLGKERKKIIYDIVVILILFSMLVSVPFFRKLIFGIQPSKYLQNKYLFFGLAWSVIILCIQNSKYIIKLLNKSSILIYIGKISFPIYLIHYIILDKLNFSNLFIKSIVTFVISIILAIIMNKLVEQPMIGISRKINKKLFWGGDNNGKV